MKKILFSLGTIIFVAAVAYGASGAFFSDSETSTGNILAAGAIDLKIDNESYVTSTTTGLLVANPNTSWTIRDLTVEKFFDFSDLKPGDIGEDTISLHVDNNDAFLCADITLTSDNENTLVDPEIDDGDVTAGPVGGGELADQVNFAWWADDGDNVLEVGENLLPGGPLGALPVGATTTVTLADSQSNIWGAPGPIPGASTRYIGKAWCFGTITPNPVAQGASTSPLVRGTGFTCSGSNANNTAQTDSFTADVSFRAVQSRNNANFTCSASTVPSNITEVNQDDLATTSALLLASPTKWFFYNDTNDTVMTIDQFAGTSGQNHMESVAGEEGAKMLLDTGVTPRYNIATSQFGDVLSTISSLKFRVYDASVDGDTPFLQFNVDFATTTVGVGYQGRLTMQPGSSTNPPLTPATWTTVDTLGTAMWTWSKFAVGPDLVASTADDNKWPDGNTNQYRTWNSIIAGIPTAKLLSPGSFLGVRTGQPGPAGATNFVSSIEFDGQTYDFEI